jgi:hypothetical protein
VELLGYFASAFRVSSPICSTSGASAPDVSAALTPFFVSLLGGARHLAAALFASLACLDALQHQLIAAR